MMDKVPDYPMCIDEPIVRDATVCKYNCTWCGPANVALQRELIAALDRIHDLEAALAGDRR